MNLMELDGYRARIEYDSELDSFRGEILGLSGGADFYGKNPRELRKEFRSSLDAYLAVCEEEGIEPHRSYSGRFNVRINPELHREAEIKARSLDVSINQLVSEALRQAVEDDWRPC